MTDSIIICRLIPCSHYGRGVDILQKLLKPAHVLITHQNRNVVSLTPVVLKDLIRCSPISKHEPALNDRDDGLISIVMWFECNLCIVHKRNVSSINSQNYSSNILMIDWIRGDIFSMNTVSQFAQKHLRFTLFMVPMLYTYILLLTHCNFNVAMKRLIIPHQRIHSSFDSPNSIVFKKIIQFKYV